MILGLATTDVRTCLENIVQAGRVWGTLYESSIVQGSRVRGTLYESCEWMLSFEVAERVKNIMHCGCRTFGVNSDVFELVIWRQVERVKT